MAWLSIHHRIWALLIVLVSVLSVQAAAIAGECVRCTHETLCAEHLAVENRLVSELTETFRSGTADEARAQLDRLTQSEEAHSNVPSPTLLRFLIENEERAERRIFDAPTAHLLAAPLLDEATDAPRALVAIAALERSKHPDVERAVIGVLERMGQYREFPKLDPKLTKRPSKLKRAKDGKGWEGAEEIEKFMDAMNEHSAKVGKYFFAHKVACGSILALAHRPSAAGRLAATNHYKRAADKNRGLLPELAASVLEFDEEVTHRLVIDSLAAHGGGLELELVREGEKVVERKTWGAGLHETLAADAVARGLPVPLVRKGDRLVDVWRRWLAENREKLASETREPTKH